ncbi:stimulator of interferon genes protein homolog [Prorops nasuta]|uniref:stimulator of interferon genes protein homolog n=1 Tax=Prorops nasuta TaxID=863751 RepID=UPI0034CF74E3
MPDTCSNFLSTKQVVLIFFSVTGVIIITEVLFRLLYFGVIFCNSQIIQQDITLSLEDLLNINRASQILVITVAILSAIAIKVTGTVCLNKEFWEVKPMIWIISLILAITILKLVNIFKNMSFNTLENMNGLDIGTGLAYSYYYGYLRIMLPSTGTKSKGLVEAINAYESFHNIQIPVKKLFILIPKSSYIPPDLKEVSYEWMEATSTLEPKTQDRSGVKNRVYHNTVYKIQEGGLDNSVSAPVFVVAEGAQPLMTFYEIMRNVNPHSPIYEKHKAEFVDIFYKTLKNLLFNDLECREICELIYYDDYNSNKRRINVAEIILQRIKAIKDDEQL